MDVLAEPGVRLRVMGARTVTIPMVEGVAAVRLTFPVSPRLVMLIVPFVVDPATIVAGKNPDDEMVKSGVTVRVTVVVLLRSPNTAVSVAM